MKCPVPEELPFELVLQALSNTRDASLKLQEVMGILSHCYKITGNNKFREASDCIKQCFEIVSELHDFYACEYVRRFEGGQ